MTFEIFNEYSRTIVLSSMWHCIDTINISTDLLTEIIDFYISSLQNEKEKSDSFTSLFSDVIESDNLGNRTLEILTEKHRLIKPEILQEIINGLEYEACRHLDGNLKRELQRVMKT